MAITDATPLVPLQDLLKQSIDDRMQSGTVEITPTPNTITSFALTFPEEFPVAPVVIVSAATTVPESEVLIVSSHPTPTTTGVTIYVYRTNATPTLVSWKAELRNEDA